MRPSGRSGLTKAWISIDGGNNNCDAAACGLAEKGHAKSRKNTNIASYMYAVNAEDGRPITYTVSNGGKVDSKAIQKMAAILSSHGIEAEGVILDRAFCTHDVFELLDRLGYPYVVMLPSDTFGHSQMVAQQHSETIRWRVPYAVGEEEAIPRSYGRSLRQSLLRRFQWFPARPFPHLKDSEGHQGPEGGDTKGKEAGCSPGPGKVHLAQTGRGHPLCRA